MKPTLLAIILLIQALCFGRQDAPAPQAASVGPKLEGVWRLVLIEDNGVKQANNPFGLLILTESGHISLQISRKDFRQKFDSDDIKSAKAAERARAFETFGSYFGRYTVDKDKGMLKITVDASLFPNETGTTNFRYFEVSEDTLVLKPVEKDEDGKLLPRSESKRRLVWKRLKPGDDIRP
ncbi:MAG: lipocalin-like domain-containing protein [Armatimonadetes bacterium]|nr:lipocalin-like domain-containing protein [Armatimonadota bacterium]